MPAEAYTAAAEAVKGSTGAWNIIALVIISVLGAFSVWMARRADMSVKLAAAETELRKARRDQQISEGNARNNERFGIIESKLNDEVMKVKHIAENAEMRARDVGGQLEKHVDSHKETEGRAHSDMREIYERLGRMENTMIRRAEVEAKIEKVETEISRMNDRLNTKMDRMTDLLNTIMGGIHTGTTHTRRMIEGDRV